MSGITSTGPIASAEAHHHADAHSRFRCPRASHLRPHGAVHRRHHAGRVRLWRGVADLAGSAGARPRGATQRDPYRRCRQCRAQRRFPRRALHLRRPRRRGRCGQAARLGACGAGCNRKRAGVRSLAPDHAKGPLRLRAFFHAHAACGLGAGTACLRYDRDQADRSDPAADRARRHRAALRLCQGRADRPRDPPHHRRRAKARQARDRRSEECQLGDLSRRDAPHAQSQGIFGGDQKPRRHFTKHRRCKRGRDAARRLRGDPGHARPARHDAGAAQRRGRSRSGGRGESA
ncbi:hypothetical protein ACVWWP_003506 [Bradyrhizobium sp. LM3.6]